MTKLKNIFLAAASIVFFANITNAQSVKASYSVTAEDPLKVQYLGDDGDYLLFRVTLLSAHPAKAQFAIEDKNEGKLYLSGLAKQSKVSTIKIEKRAADQVLNFRLVLGRKTFTKSFSINTSLVETTIVSEADLTKL
ncbi:MAG: hypothetical protein WKI04_13750 [Ferruginibacter sp.]